MRRPSDAFVRLWFVKVVGPGDVRCIRAAISNGSRFEHFPFLVPYTLQSPQPRHCRASIAVRLLSLAKSTPPQHCPCPALAAQVVRGATTTASRCRSSTPSDSFRVKD
ncbi:hypothetical protein LWI28_019648 [Acer negundo]|uniref:Uncharacterized protein n=1 Tax=Acer negundo TaxID=4023 RepID=A0AAD5NV33_ACENE|nr:hypothetical protein LWI28_019648 [Acer negundo]